MFFFLTLYMQVVLGWGALETGAAYLPFSAVMAVTSGVVAKALDGRSARGLLLAGPVDRRRGPVAHEWPGGDERVRRASAPRARRHRASGSG